MILESITLLLLCHLGIAVINETEMEGRIVKGHFAPIELFSYVAFVSVKRGNKEWICGGSIVNQIVILTAGHCIEEYYEPDTSIVVNVGNSNRMRGMPYIVENHKLHELYDGDMLLNDIALLKLREELRFGRTVTRVSFAKRIPYGEKAALAGWGLTDEVKLSITDNLMDITNIRLWRRKKCEKILKDMPKGTFCGGYKHAHSFVAQGDSGSALVARHFIQIGLVSYKIPDISDSLVIYTSVPYFRNWITRNMRRIICQN